MIDSTEKDILLLLLLAGSVTLVSMVGGVKDGRLGDGGLEVTSTSISELSSPMSSSSSADMASALMAVGEWAGRNSGGWWCWNGETWKRIGINGLFQQDGWESPPTGCVVIPSAPPTHPSRCNPTAACCSRWNITASRSRSAKALLLRIRSLIGGGGVSGILLSDSDCCLSGEGDTTDPLCPLWTHCL